MSDVPAIRLRRLGDAPLRPERGYVLYWMIAARRPTRSFALDRAAALARDLGRPLVILEALRVGYPHASDRLHRFVLDGMRDNARAFARTPARYLPYVEPEPGAGRGLLSALAARACAVVTDDFPAFFLPRMTAAAASKIDVRLEAVDGVGLLPLAAAPKAYARAVDFRRFLQRALPEHLGVAPSEDPLSGLPRAPDLPGELLRRWPPADAAVLSGRTLPDLPIDHDVGVAPRRAAPGPRAPPSGASSTAPCAATTRTPGTPTPTRRAACRPTCTSATSRPTRSSRPSPRPKAGARTPSASRPGGPRPGGGGWARAPRPSSISS